MRKYLLPESGNFYKANLHCHSTISDGKYTVDELKDIYKDAGYSVLAYTDHNILIDHSDKNDDDFLTITSCEIDISAPRKFLVNHTPCYHLNFYAKEPGNTAMPCFNAENKRVRDEFMPSFRYVGSPDYVRDYDKVNELIDEFRKNGFIACLNHTTWSIQDLDDYKDIQGIFAMEVYNNSCYVAGFDEINTHAYDDLLRRGNRIACVASDDNHNAYPRWTRRWDSLGGFVNIKAPDLSYKSIITALEAGDFYASTGPEIYEMYVEDEELHVKTSAADRIALTTYGRRTNVCYSSMPGGTLSEAVFKVQGPYDRYIRVTVSDGRGHYAWSKAYFDACGMENGKFDEVPFRS